MTTAARRVHCLLLVLLLAASGSLNARASASASDDTPRQNGDLFVGGASLVDGFGNTAGGVWRVRGNVATLFCASPASSFDPGFWNEPISLIVDARGRIVFLAPIAGQNIGLLRCDQPGAPAEWLAAFHAHAAVPPGWPVPFPDLGFSDGIGFLHVVRERAIHEDFQRNPQVVNEDAYEFVAQARGSALDPTPPSVLFRYGADSGIWQSGWELPDLANQTGNLTSVVVHGDSLWSVSGSTIRLTSMPLTLKASGKIGGTDFTLSYGLFGGVHELTGAIADDTAIPNVSSGCNTDPPGLHDDVTDLMPLVGSGFSPFGGQNVYYDEQGDLGLVFTTNYGPMPGPYLTHVASALLNDDPLDDHDGYFHQAYDSCRHVPWIQFSSILPWISSDGTVDNAADVIATAPGGMVGTQFRGNRVVRLTPGDHVTPIVTLYHPTSIAAYPAVVPVSGTVVYITVHSPVDVLVTDASGHRIGVDPATGAAVNDFGQHGFDSGPGEPRIVAIENPAPGAFTLHAVGTGAGPYTIDVASADMATGASFRVTTTGTAAPGAQFAHDFSLGADSVVTFASTPAPPDTTVPAVQCAVPDAAWHAVDVSIACAAADTGSGLANASDNAFALSTRVASGIETSNASTGSRIVCDVAGNCATAGPIEGIRIDRKAPAIQFALPPAATFIVGADATHAVACDDGGSGVASCVASPAIVTTAIGTRSTTVQAADPAGNSASATASYTVRYALHYVLDDDQDEVRFTLTDAAGRNLSSRRLGVVATGIRFAGSPTVLPLRRDDDDERVHVNGDSYTFRWHTKKLAAGEYELLLTASGQDGYAIPFTVAPRSRKR